MSRLGIIDTHAHLDDNRFDSDRAAVMARLGNDMEAVKNMVARGLGVSIVPAVSVAREVERGDLLAFDVTADRKEDMRTFYLVAKKDRKKNSLKQQFVKYVKERYGIEA